MTREELIVYDRWLTENKWGSSEIITPEQAADLYLAKHPLPPAEGAEEYIKVKHPQDWDEIPQWHIDEIKEFATPHAQQIADKMVEENLVEFGNMIRDEPNGDIAALAEYFIRTINLKSREK